MSGFKKDVSGMDVKKGDREKLILTGTFVLSCLFFALQFAARGIDGFGEWYASFIYPILENSLGRLFGLFPFSVVELLLYGGVAGFLIYSILHLKQWKKILYRVIFSVAALLVVYTINCGINYYRTPFSDFLDFEIRARSTDELKSLMEELTKQVNSTGKEKAKLETKLKNREIGALSVKAMEALGEQYPVLSGFYPRPKELIFSEVLSVQQLAGIYSPFTIEANFNGDMPSYNIPHTACHELSHLKGFMKEDEANFIGFLACIGSEDATLSYSGYLTGWVYVGNALAAEDWDSYLEFWDLLNEDSKKELRENNSFWSRYNTKAAKVSEVVNDTYLKANRQTDGVKSYGKVVDLILAWYHQ